MMILFILMVTETPHKSTQLFNTISSPIFCSGAPWTVQESGEWFFTLHLHVGTVNSSGLEKRNQPPCRSLKLVFYTYCWYVLTHKKYTSKGKTAEKSTTTD